MSTIEIIQPIARPDPVELIEKDELVEGGPEGAANKQAIALLNNIAYIQEQTYTKQETQDIIAELKSLTAENKEYFDEAFLRFENGSFKSYPTLALANADIANISINTKVSVLSESEGGDYYKATENATTLTKSQYDPSKKARNQIEAVLRKAAGKKQIKRFPEYQDKSAYFGDENKIENGSSFNILNDSVVTSVSISSSADIRELKIKGPDGDYYSWSILPLESVVNESLTTRWEKLNIDRVLTDNRTGVIVEADGGFRVKFLFPEVTENSGTGNINVVDKSGIFSAKRQTELSSFDGFGISTHYDGNLQIKIPALSLSQAGYEVNESGAIAFIRALVPYLDIYYLTSNAKTLKTDLYYSYLPPGNYLPELPSGVSVAFCEVAGKKTINGKGSFIEFESVIKNNSNQIIAGGLVELKVNFDKGVVFSDSQIVVKKSNGNIVPAQFTPDFNVNYRDGGFDGYHVDSSFKSGSIYVLDSLNIDESETYVVRVYDSEVNPIEFNYTKLDQGATFKYSIFGFSFSVGKVNANIIQNLEVQPGIALPFNGSVRFYSSHSSDPASSSSTLIQGVGHKVARVGNVFLDIEWKGRNNAYENVSADSLEVSAIVRLFRNGMIRVITNTKTLKDINSSALLGVMTNLLYLSNNFTQCDITPMYSSAQITLASGRYDAQAVYYHGDVHRDGLTYGPSRPNRQIISKEGNVDCRFGWQVAYNAATITQWPIIPKGTAWGAEVALMWGLNKTPKKISDFMNNIPSGFIGNREFRNISKNRLLKSISEYNYDVMDWWYSDYATSSGGNPSAANSTRYIYATELMRLIETGRGSFDSIYTKFINMVKARFGSNLAQVGSRYQSGSFAMAQESRHIAPALQWLYKYAVDKNEISKITDLQILGKSIAEALRDYYLINNGIGMVGNGTDRGASNVIACAMRFFAIAIYMGQDQDGSIRSVFDACEQQLIDSSGFMPTLNQLNDGRGEEPARSRYYHYAMYGISAYITACSLLNKMPIFDVSQFALNGLNGSGEIRDFEYCVSESRRGGRNTVGFLLHALSYYSRSGNINAAIAALEALKKHQWNNDGSPKRMYGFDGTTSDASNVMTDVAFNQHALADLWLSFYYGFYK